MSLIGGSLIGLTFYSVLSPTKDPFSNIVGKNGLYFGSGYPTCPSFKDSIGLLYHTGTMMFLSY